MTKDNARAFWQAVELASQLFNSGRTAINKITLPPLPAPKKPPKAIA